MIRHPRYWLYNIRYRLKFVLSGACGHACDWCHPFGWIPEDGCPVHDIEQKNHGVHCRTDTTGTYYVEGEFKNPWLTT